MWSKLDDALIDHPKLFEAGDGLGKDGPGLALGLYTLGLLWTNKHLTNGHLPGTVVKRWPHFAEPLKLADALVRAGLWEKNGHGFSVHDFHDHNPTAEAVKQKRDEDRKRKAAKKS